MSEAAEKINGWIDVRNGMPEVGATAERSKDISAADKGKLCLDGSAVASPAPLPR